MVLGPCIMSAAIAQTYGSWTVDTADDKSYLYAATANDSGNVLGEYCYPQQGSCVWILGMATSCEENHTYPMLANADVGAQHLEVVCRGQLPSKLYQYVFTKFDDIDRIVKQGSKVGFAIPLQEDQFRVVRFLLVGATAAIKNMRATATGMNSGHHKQSTGTADQDI